MVSDAVRLSDVPDSFPFSTSPPRDPASCWTVWLVAQGSFVRMSIFAVRMRLRSAFTTTAGMPSCGATVRGAPPLDDASVEKPDPTSVRPTVAGAPAALAAPEQAPRPTADPAGPKTSLPPRLPRLRDAPPPPTPAPPARG